MHRALYFLFWSSFAMTAYNVPTTQTDLINVEVENQTLEVQFRISLCVCIFPWKCFLRFEIAIFQGSCGHFGSGGTSHLVNLSTWF
jgi:hypothetical protein